MMTSSLKAEGLADNFLGQFVELLSVFAPHLGSIHVGATFVVGLCGDRREGSKVREGDIKETEDKGKV